MRHLHALESALGYVYATGAALWNRIPGIGSRRVATRSHTLRFLKLHGWQHLFLPMVLPSTLSFIQAQSTTLSTLEITNCHSAKTANWHRFLSLTLPSLHSLVIRPHIHNRVLETFEHDENTTTRTLLQDTTALLTFCARHPRLTRLVYYQRCTERYTETMLLDVLQECTPRRTSWSFWGLSSAWGKKAMACPLFYRLEHLESTAEFIAFLLNLLCFLQPAEAIFPSLTSISCCAAEEGIVPGYQPEVTVARLQKLVRDVRHSLGTFTQDEPIIDRWERMKEDRRVESIRMEHVSY